ncbi:MAG: SIR2 family protein [Phycisphaerales bacterium]
MPLATELTEPMIQRSTLYGNAEERLELLRSVQALAEGMRELRGPIGIEEFIALTSEMAEMPRLAQHMELVGRHDGETPWSESEHMENAVDDLQDEVVEEIWDRQSKADLAPLAKWARSVSSDDTILTFNYDTLAEDALRLAKHTIDLGFTQASRGLRVLKLHGSIDWITVSRDLEPSVSWVETLFQKVDRNADRRKPRKSGEVEYDIKTLRVTDREQLDQKIRNRAMQWSNSAYQFGIARLGPNKPLHEIPGLGSVWINALNALFHAKQIIPIGFSFSEYDVFARLQMLRVMQGRRKQSYEPRVTVVDPGCGNEEFKKRVNALFKSVSWEPTSHQDVDWPKLLGANGVKESSGDLPSTIADAE